MLHLIERIIPASVHRALLPTAHSVRRRWRKLVKRPLRGVSVVLTDAKGDVLLVRHTYGRPSWALPGGGLSRSEDPLDGARRELFEELALDLPDLELIGELDEVISGSPHQAYVFAANCDSTPRPDRREIMEARFFDPAHLPHDVSALTMRRLELLQSQKR